MAENGFYLKDVPAQTVAPGDVIFRRTKAGADLLMGVKEVHRSLGADLSCTFAGPVEDYDGNKYGDQEWTVGNNAMVARKTRAE